MIKKRETAERAIANGKPKVNQWSEELLSDSDLLLSAVKAYPGSVWSIPSQYYVTEELCIEGVSNGLRLSRIPVEQRTSSVCSAAVKTNGVNITDVPEDLVTEEMCIDTVRTSPRMLANINKQTEKVDLEAVKVDGLVLQYAQFLTDEVIETAIKQNGVAIMFVPKERISNKWCIMAVTNNGLAYKDIPNEYYSNSLSILAVQHGCPLSHIPICYQSDKLYLEYLKAGGNAGYLPHKKITEAFEVLLNRRCNIIPTETEKKEWQHHIYETLVSLAEDYKEFLPSKEDSFDALVNSLLLWAHEYNGGYKLTGSRLCDWLSQEYEMYYGK